MPQLSLSALDEFRVIGNSQSLQTSLINGTMSTTAIYAYELQPVKTGDLSIPGFSLEWKGQLLTTEPIPIKVSQGSGAPAASPQTAPAQPGNQATARALMIIHRGLPISNHFVGGLNSASACTAPCHSGSLPMNRLNL
jgi:hypothetical protein